MNAHHFRMLFIAGLLALTGVSTALLKPVPAPPPAAPDLESLMPEKFGPWRRIDLSEAVLPAERELQPGEAVAYRAYQDDLGRVVTLVAAYGPPLGDSVRLHRPETCYVAQGFAIRSRAESEFEARGRSVALVDLDAESPSRREGVTYWLREGSAFTTKAGGNGWRRLSRGGSNPLDGALLRVSTINAEEPQFAFHREFLVAFVDALGPEGQRTLLGEAAPS